MKIRSIYGKRILWVDWNRLPSDFEERKEQHQKENINFFCNELLKIEEYMKIILGILQNK